MQEYVFAILEVVQFLPYREIRWRRSSNNRGNYILFCLNSEESSSTDDRHSDTNLLNTR